MLMCLCVLFVSGKVFKIQDRGERRGAGAGLPDLASLPRIHWRANSALKGFGKLRCLGERPVDSPAIRSMRVRQELQLFSLLASLGAPILTLSHEEQLPVRPARSRLALLLPQLPLHRSVGDLDAPDVSDVLAECQLPVHVLPVQLHTVVQLDHTACPLLERVFVRVGPPLLHPPLRVELPPLVVEPVGHLMPQDRPDRPEVARSSVGGGEERLLQDARRHEDSVLVVAVKRVHHGRRRRPPPVALHGAREPRERVVDVPLVEPVPVLHEVAGEGEAAVVRPCRGEADGEEHVGQLVGGEGLGLVVHPRDLQDLFLEHVPDPAEHVLGLRQDVH
mmetsp:Transcript_31134/g.99919  ORF Transcript_31134/g.99919 Transcript_31134/m.99919 type:complete len:334 (+) Transcript_31134:1558-2559(+)